MTAYLVKRKDGSISITTLIEGNMADEVQKWTDSAEVESFEELDVSKIPTSRNYRDAWVHNGDAVGIDLEKAKKCHKKLIGVKSRERIEMDEYGERDTSKVKEEAAALDIDGASTIKELYEKWPASIDIRKGSKSTAHEKRLKVEKF